VVYPVCGTGAVTETSLAAARSVGIECVIGAYGDGISICRAASIGVPAILIELGGCGRWSEDQVAQYLGYMKNVLGRIGILPENGCAAQARLYTQTSNVQTSECDGFWYPRLSAGAAVKKGELVGVLKDAFGQVVHSYKADESGTVMYVVTSLAINEGAPLYSILTSGCEAK
jgi:predicted deacylase